MSEIIVFEGVSPRGHVEFNREYLKYLGGRVLDFYVGKSIEQSYSNVQHNSFNDYYVFKGRLLHAVGFLLQLISVLLSANRRKCKHVFLLSYDISTMCLGAYLAKFLGIKITTVEHNTLPVTLLKRCLVRLSPNNVTYICLMPSAAKLLEGLGKEALYIDLPIIKREATSVIDEKNHNYKGVVFCPSSSGNFTLIEKRASQNPNILFNVKGDNKSKLNNLVCTKYFEDYYKSMAECDFVYLPVNFDYRVSGPLYEAIGLNKTVIISQCDFAQYAKQLFGESVNIDNGEFGSYINAKHTGRFNVNSYNENVMSRLNEVFFLNI
ncbi:hypothetical protein [Shewanella colwelliana]|uniref:hypothetical protein n=1 Tax=Shewanella colwelliana TaxID=23 RepID=UPI0022AFA7AE|nr:hypothetical protein [Shewanella colwelliana]MCZ4336720.1 hypothetical protein [Shewanella colwelliana]